MMTTTEIEIAVAKHINWRKHLIVPNVSWGLGFRHELDLAVVTRAGYIWEIEIKISKSDLKADLKKWHQHRDIRISRLYFALPETMINCLDLVPDHAGVFIVNRSSVKIQRQARNNRDARPLTAAEISKIQQLAAMRIWGLKQKLNAFTGNKTQDLEESK